MCHSDTEDLGALLARLSPSEILLPSNFDADFGAEYTVLETEILSSERAAHVLSDYFNVANLSLLGDLSRAHIAACGTLLAYLQQTQIAQMPRLARPHIEAPEHHLGLDAATRANLELTHTQTGEKTGSLLATIDMTVSAAGARANWQTGWPPRWGIWAQFVRGIRRCGFLSMKARRAKISVNNSKTCPI